MSAFLFICCNEVSLTVTSWPILVNIPREYNEISNHSRYLCQEFTFYRYPPQYRAGMISKDVYLWGCELGLVFTSYCAVNISEYQSDLSLTIKLNYTFYFVTSGETRSANLSGELWFTILGIKIYIKLLFHLTNLLLIKSAHPCLFIMYLI